MPGNDSKNFLFQGQRFSTQPNCGYNNASKFFLSKRKIAPEFSTKDLHHQSSRMSASSAQHQKRIIKSRISSTFMGQLGHMTALRKTIMKQKKRKINMETEKEKEFTNQ